jgi:uncharacterized protein (DUF302 family)
MVMQRSELIPIKIGSKTALKPGGTMSQPISFTLDLELPFEDVFEKVTTALKDEGFGVLTKIDVKETMKQKLGVDFHPYLILGACNPPLAHRALSSMPEVGILLPCNVTIEQRETSVLVTLANPEAMMMVGDLTENTALREVAAEARTRLERVAHNLRSQ